VEGEHADAGRVRYVYKEGDKVMQVDNSGVVNDKEK
jgi:hypothetical protein